MLPPLAPPAVRRILPPLEALLDDRSPVSIDCTVMLLAVLMFTAPPVLPGALLVVTMSPFAIILALVLPSAVSVTAPPAAVALLVLMPPAPPMAMLEPRTGLLLDAVMLTGAPFVVMVPDRSTAPRARAPPRRLAGLSCPAGPRVIPFVPVFGVPV